MAPVQDERRSVPAAPRIKAWLSDMDGVLISLQSHEPIDGASEFVKAFRDTNTPFLLVTNNPHWTPEDLQARLAEKGIDVPAESIYTSAMATADFIAERNPAASVYVVGDDAVKQACRKAGLEVLPDRPDRDADYVVVGELQHGIPPARNPLGPDRTAQEAPISRTIDLEVLETAFGMLNRDANFVATNPDLGGPSPDGKWHAATGSWAQLFAVTCGKTALYMGKPEQHMMQTALRRLGVEASEVVMVGDTMATDIKFGEVAGTQTALVLSGSSKAEDLQQYPYRPTRVFDSVKDLVSRVGQADPLQTAAKREFKLARAQAIIDPALAPASKAVAQPAGTAPTPSQSQSQPQSQSQSQSRSPSPSQGRGHAASGLSGAGRPRGADRLESHTSSLLRNSVGRGARIPQR